MLELNLVLSEKFNKDDAEAIQAELSEYLKVGKPSIISRRSADTTSLVQLLGDVADWLPLKAAAAVYLSAVLKRAGDVTWDRLASRFNSSEVKPLADVATTLATTAEHVDGGVEIVVGLNIPDNHFGTAISIKSSESKEVARVLASFIIHVEKLSKAMQEEIEAGRVPLGPAIIKLQDDGSLLIRWRKQNDLSVHELRLPRTDHNEGIP